MTQDPTKLRQFSRIDYITDAHLQWEGHVVPCQVQDLSLRGAQVNVDSELPEVPMELHIELGSPGPKIYMNVIIMRQEKGIVGLRCEQIDLDSLINLRRVLEANLGDPEQVEQELSKLSAA